MFDSIDTHSILLIAIMSVITFLLRVFPFVVFGGKRKTPDFIIWLGKVLPPAIIGMLVVYCLKNISFVSYPHGLPEFIACLSVVLLHLWKKNALLSIGGGTICYMLLIQFVFK